MVRLPRCALRLALVVVAALLPARGASAAEPRSFAEGRWGDARLEYIGDVPVLHVAGDPKQIGRQQGALLGEAVRRLTSFPQTVARGLGLEPQIDRVLERGDMLWRRAGADHSAELTALAEEAKVDLKLLIGANTLMDVYRAGWGCSSLIVLPPQRGVKSPLFARNLDFPSFGLLHRHTLVTVYRPDGKQAFAVVGFAGLIGALSGMNESGLAIAVHNVYRSADGSRLFNPEGAPYTLVFRRILEECKTVDDAEKVLRASPRSTMLNLAVCDPTTAAVFEITPKTVARRDPQDGFLPCTNHFRTESLAIGLSCRRYETLLTAQTNRRRIDVAVLCDYLHRVNQGAVTIQSMVFEPADRRLHVALSQPPVSDGPYRVLELAPWFERPADRR